MSEVRRLARHSSVFFASNVLILLAGAISLPVWTRLLSQEQYGLFALYNVTITFMVAVCKFGIQHASLRFYSDTKAGKLDVSLPAYYTTMVLGGLCISVSVVVVSVAAAHWLLSGAEALWELLVPVGAAILAQSTANVLLMFLRVEQQVKLQATLLVVQRYGRFGAGLLLVWLLGVTVANIFWGFVLSGALLCLGLLARLVRQGKLVPREFSLKLLKGAVAYGFPLVGLEISNDVLMLGDRYLLQYYLGASAVGIYSAGYNASMMAATLLMAPLRLAVVPMYLESWNQRGPEATSRFLGQALKYYAALAIPLALGFSWYRKEIITLLASDRYAEAATVVPYVICPVLLHGAYAVYAAGLYIRKRTFFLMGSTLAAAAINVILNVLFIPRGGLVGAALATLVAYVALALWIYHAAERQVHVPLHPWFMAKVAALAVAAVLGADLVAGGAWLLVKIVLVILFYGGAMLAFDRDARRAAEAARGFLGRGASKGP